MTIELGETYRYYVIHPGTRSFESKTPGTLFVALSRAKSTGRNGGDLDLAFHPSVFVNEDRLCHVVDTPTTKARRIENVRIRAMAQDTRQKYASLYQNAYIVEKLMSLSIHVKSRSVKVIPFMLLVNVEDVLMHPAFRGVSGRHRDY